MTADQGLAMLGMFFVGAVPFAVWTGLDDDVPRFWKIGLPIWTVFWCVPPLVTLWLKGVMG